MVTSLHENRKEIIYDHDLQIEAYRFHGIAQAFPNHFHEYYVIGLIEMGTRHLTVNNQKYIIGTGDFMTFHPRDNHACEQADGGVLGYLCMNIKAEIMESVAYEVLGSRQLPCFPKPVQNRAEIGPVFCDLHRTIMRDGQSLEKEELFLICMRQLLLDYAVFGEEVEEPAMRQEIQAVCAFLEQHYAERITLDTLSRIANLNKYSLVRIFTRYKGITPYRYLETVRIGEAKKLLEQGVEPIQVAQQTGFSDQSHFSHYFSRLIGLSPGHYQAIFRED